MSTHSLPARSTNCSLLLHKEQGEGLEWWAIDEREDDEVEAFNEPVAVL